MKCDKLNEKIQITNDTRMVYLKSEVDAAIEALNDAASKLVAKPTWIYGDTNDDGSITQTVMFEPDPTTGKGALPEGTVLEPMVLYALFEDAAATASAVRPSASSSAFRASISSCVVFRFWLASVSTYAVTAFAFSVRSFFIWYTLISLSYGSTESGSFSFRVMNARSASSG